MPGASTITAGEPVTPELPAPDPPDPLDDPPDPPELEPPLAAQPETSTTRSPLSPGRTTLVPPGTRLDAEPPLDPVPSAAQGTATTIRSPLAVGTSNARRPAVPKLELERMTVAHTAQMSAPVSSTQISGEADSTRRPPSDSSRSPRRPGPAGPG